MELTMSELEKNNHFLNLIFDNINSAIFLVDQHIRIRHLNNAFKSIFKKEASEVLMQLCGNAIGCSFAVREKALCGETSHCSSCEIRKGINNALIEGEAVKAQVITREFEINGIMQLKYLKINFKALKYKNKTMVMLIVDDITETEKARIEVTEQNKRIRSMNKQYRMELKLAQKVQRDIIPKSIPQFPELRIASRYYPLEAIGGDIYDIISIDKNNFGIFISDVSGHGLPAAMVTTMLKALVRSDQELLLKPDEFCAYLNYKFMDLSKEMYLSVIYGVYNRIDHSFTYVRCGHPHMFHIRHGEVREVVDEGTFLLGFTDTLQCPINRLNLKRNDKLLIYTDGLTETWNSEKEEYGDVLPYFLEANHELDVHNLFMSLDESLLRHKGHDQFHDDICYLGIEVTGNKEDIKYL